MSNLNKYLLISPNGRLAFRDKKMDKGQVHALPVTLGVRSHQPSLEKTMAPHLWQRNRLEPFQLLNFHSITDALYKHSDTEKRKHKGAFIHVHAI